MDLYPRPKKSRRPHISSGASEDVKSQKSKKRKSASQKLDPDAKRRRLSKAKRLDLHAFVSLPQTVMARVCRYLHPTKLLTLSRTCKLLRTIFMSKQSKPYWDECRSQLEIPDWNHVSAPQAMAFLYETTCQVAPFSIGAWDVMSPDSWDACTFVGNTALAAQGQNMDDVRRKWPDLPHDLVTRLLWTPKRNARGFRIPPPPRPSADLLVPQGPDVSPTDLREGRFYLEDDVLKLLRQFQRLKHQPSRTLTALRAELTAKQRAGQAIAVEILRWYERTKKREQRKFNGRWNIISAVMASRWGWNPVPYSRLSSRLKEIVDYLISLPDVTNDTWDRVRGNLTMAIKAEARGDTQQRPFALRSADPASERGTP
ncbi:hypothetical protein FRC00_013663 [Tulasnella sp. 408]|nr:hypothetical protein FRC00_013663 [Tulasnella sp. 408]